MKQSQALIQCFNKGKGKATFSNSLGVEFRYECDEPPDAARSQAHSSHSQLLDRDPGQPHCWAVWKRGEMCL